MRMNGNLVFSSDASGEIQNAYFERLAVAPAFNANEKGRVYFNTNLALYFFNNGSAWVALGSGSGGGSNGESAYQLAVDAGYQGTLTQWLASLKGVKGDQGIQGIQGIQGVKGDTGTQGLKGDTGVQGIKGDTGNQGIQGVKGDTGNQGIQGLKGNDGVKGDTGNQGVQGIQGLSAYDVAVANGFQGTQQQWLDSLKGTGGSSGPSPVLVTKFSWEP